MYSNIKLVARIGLSAASLKVGEYATVTDGGLHRGDIVLKTRNGIANLSDPSFCWDVFTSPHVERLNTGDKVEITVGFTTEFEISIRDEAVSNKITAIKRVREVTNCRGATRCTLSHLSKQTVVGARGTQMETGTLRAKNTRETYDKRRIKTNLGSTH